MRYRIMGIPLDMRLPVRYVCLMATAIFLLLILKFGNNANNGGKTNLHVKRRFPHVRHDSLLRWRHDIIPRAGHLQAPRHNTYTYQDPSRNGNHGNPIYVPDGDILTKLGIPVRRFVDLTHGVPMPVVLMAMSKSRFDASLESIAAVQHHLPSLKIVVYDLGLTTKQRQKLGTICNVVVRKFLYGQYPKHVRFLYKFAWKALVIQKALMEFGGVLWIEQNMHITGSEATLKSALKEAKDSGILLFGGRSGYTTFRVTHPQMYKFLVTDVKRASATAQVFSAPLLIYNTREIQDKLMHWWVLCSLDMRCISPPGASKLACKRMGKKGAMAPVRVRQKSGKVVKRRRRCHMFDQSVLNILLKNLHNYDSSSFLSKVKIAAVTSKTIKPHEVKQCRVALKQTRKAPGGKAPVKTSVKVTSKIIKNVKETLKPVKR